MSQRTRRVSEIMHRELSTIIQRELTFPVPLVTVSAVDVTPDLKNAHVYVSIIGEKNKQETVLDILEKNRGFLQSEMSKRVIIKNTPRLYFHFDVGVERGSRVINILDELGLNGPLPADSPIDDEKE